MSEVVSCPVNVDQTSSSFDDAEQKPVKRLIVEHGINMARQFFLQNKVENPTMFSASEDWDEDLSGLYWIENDLGHFLPDNFLKQFLPDYHSEAEYKANGLLGSTDGKAMSRFVTYCVDTFDNRQLFSFYYACVAKYGFMGSTMLNIKFSEDGKTICLSHN